MSGWPDYGDWNERAEQLGHVLKRDEDGAVDLFVVDSGFHNGPGCSRCGESWCHHCTNAASIEPCKGEEFRLANKWAAEDRILAEADEIRSRRETQPTTTSRPSGGK